MATLSQMGVPAAGFGILQPKQKNRWQVTFTKLASLVPAVSSRDITRQAVEVDRPNISFSEIPIHRYNSVAYIAGKYEWEPIKITVEDDLTGLASSAIQGQLETQQRLIGADLTGQWLASAATGSDYKFGTILQMLDGNEGVVEQWELSGCFIKSADYGQVTYENGEAVTISLSIRFDHALQTITGQGYGTALAGFA